MRRFWASSLAFVLVFASLAELAGHDHGAAGDFGGDLAARQCVADHGLELAVAPDEHRGRQRDGLTAAAEGHEHRCLACRLSAQRYAALGDLALWGPSLVRELDAASERTSRALPPWTGHSKRGPPSLWSLS